MIKFNKDNPTEWKWAGMWLSDFNSETDSKIINAVKSKFPETESDNIFVSFEIYSDEELQAHDFGFNVCLHNMITRNKSGAKDFVMPDASTFAEKSEVLAFDYVSNRMEKISL